MIVDIRGTNTRNKGAQLMLEVICAQIGDKFELTHPPFGTDYHVRARLGLRQTLYEPVFPRLSSLLGNAAPGRIRREYGLVSNGEIGGVLDASGFLYTDQFDVSLPRREALVGREWARRGVRKIMLPQAFGPFDHPGTRRWSREALEQAGLIFVRDRVSEGHLRGLGITTPVVRSPDFTIGAKPAEIEPICDRPFVALVPNNKLFTHGKFDRQQYVNLFVAYEAAAEANGLTSVVVVHEETDRGVADEIARRIDAPVFEHPDPLVLKSALGQASAAVASRFHAVVGCLSQAVPTLALGWSHKYRELLDDFGVADRLVTSDTSPQAAFDRLLADAAGTARQKDRIPEIVAQVDAMWDRTIEMLNA